ncbi:hypothetical protein, partial [Pseudomonas aeruginosa]|uniref:hypothetical protein n=1 Tax=Pseudomonas aeruginosa TaxID=287 RepID=UPI0031B685BB
YSCTSRPLKETSSANPQTSPFLITMPTNQCPWRMQVHHITQETPDVWTISLICHDYYPYRAGQYALVSVRNSAETLRAYTISSTPGVSEYIPDCAAD